MDRALQSVLVSMPYGSGASLIDRVASLPLVDTARVVLLRIAPWLARQRSSLLDRTRDHLSADVSRARRLLDVGPMCAIVSTRPLLHEIAEEARTMRAELIVMDRDERSAARVVERTRVPVLLARTSSRPYHRPLIALDVERHARDLVAVTLRVVSGPQPELAFAHAYHDPFSPSASPSLSWHLANERLWSGHLRLGDPLGVIRSVASELRSDLVVLGVRSRSPIVRAFTGNTAVEVARATTCDVLFVPVR